MKPKIFFGLLIFSGFVLFQCTDKKDPVSVPTHPSGWTEPASANFHGKALAENGGLNAVSCQSCHGSDYLGGTSGVACGKCHNQYPHPQGWLNSASQNFHGGAYLANPDPNCQGCHGSDYQGGSSRVSCYKCHDQFPHPGGWLQQNQANFHGAFLLTGALDLANCQNCHGQDYKGGSSKVSCFTCHAAYPHPEGFANNASPNFHSGAIAEQWKWDILPCRSCHGTDYAGAGFQQKNCLACHTAPNGPEACNTCHGGIDNAAPPLALGNQTSPSFLGVGVHQQHVAPGVWSTFSAGQCQTCHKTPANYSDPGHIDDDGIAEVMFNSLANFNGEANTTWNRNGGSCNNVYCHGAFEFKKSQSQYQWAYVDTVMSGRNAAVNWQYPNTGQALCGSCHGLPPAGHAPVYNCSGCHGSVVDENLNIVNKYLHINGRIDVFN